MLSTLSQPLDARVPPVRRYTYAVVAVLILSIPPFAVHGGGLDGIPVCHGFGCRIKESVSITEEEWNQIKAFFRKPAETPEQEREQIRKATGWFEVVVGRHTPTYLDRGGNKLLNERKNARLGRDELQFEASSIGQMDCIDKSLNMTTYLTLMQEAGLFRYHRVVERARRRSIVDQHYAAQIEEIDTGSRWVVDSWFYDYGSLPYVENAAEWHAIPFLLSTSYPASSDD